MASRKTHTEPEGLSFHQRLRVERERLGLTQEQFALLGGISKATQWHYEAERGWPTAEYLVRLHASKVDVTYVVTGCHFEDRLDWAILREALFFVQRSLVNRPGCSFSEDELFGAFRKTVEAAMQLTRSADVDPKTEDPGASAGEDRGGDA